MKMRDFFLGKVGKKQGGFPSISDFVALPFDIGSVKVTRIPEDNK